VQKDGRTALTEACRKRHKDIVQLLLAVPGLNVNAARVSCVSESGKRLHSMTNHPTGIPFAASLSCGRTAGCGCRAE
jgi:hypothetical protein